MRVEGTLYSFFGNAELERITELEKEGRTTTPLKEKEKNEILRKVILLQDTIKGKNKTISEQQREIKVYEEELSFMRKYGSRKQKMA